jgi:hypothetical protein
MSKLTDRQNEPELLKILEASSSAYHNAKIGEIIITYVLIVLALAYPICYVLIPNEKIKLCLFICSFFLSVFVMVFSSFIKGNTSKGALLKEQFDCKLFLLRPKSTVEQIDSAEISKLSLGYKGKPIRDWYSVNVSESMVEETQIAVHQHSNTSWDIALRKKYRFWLITFLIIYTVLLWVFLISQNVPSQTIFLLHFSILSFYSHFTGLIKGHTAAIKKRSAISKTLDKIICEKRFVLQQQLRDIQDEIYLTRLEAAKVPDFFFRWFKKEMDAVNEDYISSINLIYNKNQ